ncbi:MAG: O-antigen ligase family protein [Actinomycetota bacterium]
MVPLAALAGLLIARGDGLLVATFAVSVLLLVMSGLRLPRILGLTGFLLLLPAQAVPFLSPQILLIAGEVLLASAIIVGHRDGELDRWTLWSAAAFIAFVALAAERALGAGDASVNPMLGFASVAAQVLLVAAGSCRSTTDREIDEFASILCVPGFFLGLWAIGEFVLHRGFAYPLVSGARRAVGPIGNPNYFGVVLAVIAVLAFGLVRTRKLVGKRSGLVALAGLSCTAGVLLTLSRGAIIAELVGLVVLWAQSLPRSRRKWVWVATLVVAVAFGPSVWRQIGSERVTADYPTLQPSTRSTAAAEAEAESLRARFLAARLGVSYAVEFPWTGIGLDRFGVMAQRDSRLGIYINTHSEPVRIAAEAGLPSLALLAAFIWMVMARIRSRSPSVLTLALPTIVSYGTASLFFNGLENMAVSFPVVVIMFLASGRSRETNGAESDLPNSGTRGTAS